ncbi:Uncharacterised protein [Peptostreptococcus anaerobius]|uniref:Peptidase S8/S53 domain-containing protein n=1 Tax=Peptostreptococcus anaerobius TaxID=1261 RepID=A0A379CD21_9FIRM|nr:S8 family serine peptidase [Peptostreptococcus anaerobius]EKX94032.1 hypothetical protein HMPREF9998_00593 [Peptostreptococcus anaerobius VPI 4330 = DSM 2949]SFN35685.1 hypothetical protein SAMN05660467_02001 [Peptostreptococcus anaerobius]SUB60322.1 Uncharacterised protein [Peptostreptococcus anaerobius]
MRKIKIAVIDTGCSIELMENMRNILFDKDLQLSAYESSLNLLEDYIGHGTMCIKNIMNILKNYENLVDIYPIKIFDNTGVTSSKRLIEVLYKLTKKDIDIINISLSTTEQSMKDEFIEVCSLLERQGKLIIVSKTLKGDDNSLLSIPATLESTIGVDGCKCLSDDEFIVRKDNKIELVFNSKKYIYILKNSINDFGLNSRATSLATAYITKLIIDKNLNLPTKELIIDELHKYSIVKNIKKHYVRKKLKNTDLVILMSIFNILKKMDINVTVYELIYEEKLFSVFYYDNIELLNLIKKVNHEFQIKIYLNKYSTEEICNIFHLIDIIKKL